MSDPAKRAAQLDRLEALVLTRLIDLLEQGQPIQKAAGPDGQAVEIGRAPAGAAYVAAAIRVLKEAGKWSDGAPDADFGAGLGELPDFDG